MSLEVTDLTVKDTARGIVKHSVLPDLPMNMCVVGSSFSGKTNLLINLIKKKQMYGGQFKTIVWITGSPDASQRALKGVKLYDTLDVLEPLFESAAKARAAGSKDNYLVIVDDLISDPLLNKRRGIMSRLYTTGRHSGISVILTSQVYKSIPKWIREASLSMIVFAMGGKEKAEFITENQCPDVNEATLTQWYDRATVNRFNFLYVDRRQCRYFHNFTTEFT